MMSLFDEDFSATWHNQEFVGTGSLELCDTGFHPKYERRLDCESEPVQEDSPEEKTEPSDDPLNREIADAYAQGYLNGHQTATLLTDQNDHATATLATALNRLKIGDQTKLAQHFWEVILSLFQQAVGHTKIDKDLMLQRCDAAVALINENIGEPRLHVAASDADILSDYDCEIPIIVDAELSPGSVRLTHAAGQIISGSIAISEAIESRIESARRAPC